MYAATPDPYCYRGTTTLKNRAGLRDPTDLEAFEAAMVTQRLDEPLPAGRLSYTRYRALLLEFAVSGRADFIISGDADLLVLNPFRSISR
jgi:hypothetical protein